MNVGRRQGIFECLMPNGASIWRFLQVTGDLLYQFGKLCGIDYF